MNSVRRVDVWTWAMVLGFAVIAVLLVWPLWSIVAASFIDNRTGVFTLNNYVSVMTRPLYQTALINSLIVSLGGMAGALALGVPLAILTTRYQIVGRDLIGTLSVLALVSPPFIGAYAWIMMLGQNGWMRHGLAAIGIELPSIYGFFGILLVFSLKFFPFVYLMTASSLNTINASVEEAAEGLGAGTIRRLFTVTLPLVLPALSSAALLVFVLSLADFGTPSIVGGRVRVLATTAYNLFTNEMGGNPGLASTTSMVLIVISLVVVALQRWAVRRRNVSGSLLRRPQPRVLKPFASVMAHLVCYAIVLAASLPSLVVVYTSLRKTSGPVFQPGFGIESYTRVMHEVPHVIANSFSYSTVSVMMIVILGTLIGYVLARRDSPLAGTLDSALMIPYIVPGVVMGVGFVVTFNVKPLEITGTATILVLMLMIRRLPYSVRSSASILKQIKGSIEEAAISLGASPAQAFLKVTLPLMLPGIIAGALMSFITAINELSSSLILYVGRTMTMPVRIYLSVLDGEFGTAAALSTILLVTSGAAVYAVFRVTGRKESAFV
ncbi:MAG: iron ABC transporter permease [Alphaproteobacteria bacterium]|nr:iron ABC transporter permease [Alphaproteobacteria bacterium]